MTSVIEPDDFKLISFDLVKEPVNPACYFTVFENVGVGAYNPRGLTRLTVQR